MIVTLASIKLFLGIEPLDTTQDAVITMFQESVEASVVSFCDSDFTAQVVTGEVVDGIQADIIVPKNYPVISVEGVYLGVDASGANGSLLDATSDYTFSASAISLIRNSTPFQRSSVRIDYTWGYSAVPGDVKMAIYQCVKAELQRYSRNTEDVSTRSKGVESDGGAGAWDATTGLPKAIVAKLASYKTFEFPTVGMAQRNL